MGDPRQEYERRLADRRSTLAAERERHARWGYVRLAIFAVAFAAVILAFQGRLSGWWILIPAASFVALGAVMARNERRTIKLERAVVYYERALERLDGEWAGKGQSGERFLDDKHLFALDLDLFGRGSVFELLSTARTGMGEEALASWLRSPAPLAEIRDRQSAVEELAPRLDLREDLAVVGQDAGSGVHPATLTAWGEAAPILEASAFRWIAAGLTGLTLLTVATLFLWSTGAAAMPTGAGAAVRVWLIALMAVLMGVNLWFLKRTGAVTRSAEEALEDLDLMVGVLERVVAERFDAAKLTTLHAALAQAPESIRALDRLRDRHEWAENWLVGLVAPFLLWNLHFAYAFESWRRAHGTRLRAWLDAVGEIEALASLAAYRYENPGYVFADLTDGAPTLDAEQLGHPLLPKDSMVANDVALSADEPLLMVSGSNMSGKSTFLRAIGVNVALAQTGAPVRARRLRLSRLGIGASIRTQDSLQEGASRFYAEITRLRAIMARSEKDPPVLFLIDEFLHGTNSHDRRIGAEAIVRGLLDRGAVGLVTTHDLALTAIAKELGDRARNVHFEDRLVDGRMAFDYRLRPGIVEKSNAIELMRSIGLDV